MIDKTLFIEIGLLAFFLGIMLIPVYIRIKKEKKILEEKYKNEE
jgi:hypothetical protein